MADLDAILERLERLETENAALRLQVGVLGRGAAAAEPAGGGPADGVVTRQQLLHRGGAGAAALGLATLGAAASALGRPEPPGTTGR